MSFVLTYPSKKDGRVFGTVNLLDSESDRRESRTDLDAERRDEELVVNLITGDRRQMAILRKV
jgi:hypothetical protein